VVAADGEEQVDVRLRKIEFGIEEAAGAVAKKEVKGEFFDEFAFGWGGGLEVLAHVLEKATGTGEGSALETGESVAESVLAGVGLAFGGSRSGGTSGVAAVGGELGFGGHWFLTGEGVPF
jgi:hypothetical protein